MPDIDDCVFACCQAMPDMWRHGMTGMDARFTSVRSCPVLATNPSAPHPRSCQPRVLPQARRAACRGSASATRDSRPGLATTRRRGGAEYIVSTSAPSPGARRGRALQGRCGQKRTRCPLASPGDSNAITEAQGRRPCAEQVGCAGRSALGCCSGSFSGLLGDSRRQAAMWHCCGQGRVPRPTALSGWGRRAAARCRPVWGQVRRTGLLDQPSDRSIPIVTKIVSAASGGRWRQERQLSG